MRAALLLVLLAAPAAAQDALRDACENELRLLCDDKTGSEVLDCLGEDPTLLTRDCRLALREAQAQAAEAVERAEAAAQGGPQKEARLVGLEGVVYLHPAGRPEGEYVTASAGTPLAAGDWIRVGAGGSASLAIDGKTYVSLSSGTDLGVASLAAAGLELRLALGRLVAKVSKVASGEGFQVRTPAAVAAVRGTELVVEEDGEEGGASRVGVGAEGRVEVSGADGGESVLLEAGEETRAAGGAAPEPPGPLRQLAPRVASFAAVRRDAARVAASWRPMEPDRLREMRRELSSRPVAPGGGRRGLTPGQQGRPQPGGGFHGGGGPGGRGGGPGGRDGGPGGRDGRPGGRDGGPGGRDGRQGGRDGRQGRGPDGGMNRPDERQGSGPGGGRPEGPRLGGGPGQRDEGRRREEPGRRDDGKRGAPGGGPPGGGPPGGGPPRR